MKARRENIGEMYDRILRSKGLPRLGEHLVLGFEFEREELVRCLHFDLMEMGAEVAIFDGCGRRAVVVTIPAEAARIREAAEANGGKEYNVNLQMRWNGGA